MRRITVIALVVLMALSVLPFAACKSSAESPTEASWSINIQDAGGSSVEFTNEDAASLELVELTAEKEKKDGSKVEENWKGVSLKAVLESAGIDDYNMVAVEASDGYSKEMDTAAVDDAGTIIGFILDGEEISVDDGLPQLVASSLPGSYWIKNVAVIKVME